MGVPCKVNPRCRGSDRECRVAFRSLDDKARRDCSIEGSKIKKSIALPCLASFVTGHTRPFVHTHQVFSFVKAAVLCKARGCLCGPA